MSYSTLDFSIENNIATINLNRPDAANGLSLEMGQDLLGAAKACQQSSDVRAVILTATGKMFCPGGDLKSFAAYGDGMTAKMSELMDAMHEAISVFARINAPVVVAVNGMAAGAGFSIAMCGDVVIAAESAKFTMAYTAAGLSPDGSASYYLPRLIGMRRTQQLMLNNQRLTAAEALDWGLLSQVVSDEELMASAQKQAALFAAGPTLAFGSVKTLLRETFDNNLEQQMDKEKELMAAMSQSNDGIEGIAAFTQKRKPEYKGS